MPEQATDQIRRVDVDELVRFDTCRLAWWYERTHPLAKKTVEELVRHQQVLEAIYGTNIQNLPEYNLVTHLQELARKKGQLVPEDKKPFDPLIEIKPALPWGMLGLVILLTIAIIAGVIIGLFVTFF
jgi:hypothetical protein